MSLLSTFRLSSHAPATLRQSSRCWRHTNLNSYASFRNASGRARPPPRSSNFSRPQEKRDWLAFLHRIPTQTVFWSIVGVNAGVFCAWQLANTRARTERDTSTLVWMFKNFTSGWFNLSSNPWTLVTSAFSHKELTHVFFNGLGLFWIAKPMLEQMGTRMFLPLYFGGAVAGSVMSLIWKKYIAKSDVPSLGASACLSAVMSFLACTAPRTPFYLYGIIGMPAWVVVSGLLSYDLYSTFNGSQSSTDTAGHVGGFVMGAAYFVLKRGL